MAQRDQRIYGAGAAGWHVARYESCGLSARPGQKASRDWNDVARSFHSRYSAGDARLWLSPTIGETLTSWSGSGNGSVASSVAYTMLKMAVFGPMPRASATTAAAESPGAPISPRTANVRSDHSIAMPQKHK